MVQMNQKWNRILEIIFEYNKKFTVREISKKTKIPSSTVQRYLKKLRKEGFITKENTSIISPYFKFRKAFFIIDKIFKSSLIEYLKKEFIPSTIIIFGSARKGEYEKESDIDLFVESHITKKVELKKYENKIGHKIQLFVKTDINKLQPNFFNNVVNGIKLYGSFKIKNG